MSKDCIHHTSYIIFNIFRHLLVNSFKFGIIYQKVNQTTEEAMFGNKTHSVAMERFLELIGQRIDLSSHSGYRGGLDTTFGHTGKESVYTQHMGKEIMFHVSTLLPHSGTDHQQLHRKRHIGNDIVSLVFQEGSTPFSPDMVTSHFLHAYLVVQPIHPHTDRYRVSVTARADVPDFGPSLPSPPVFKAGPEFRCWVLDKLLSAETACYKAEKFSKLKQRTQATLLKNLMNDLTNKTEEFLDTTEEEVVRTMTKVETSFLKNVKKVIANKQKDTLVIGEENLIHKSNPVSRTSSGNDNMENCIVEYEGGETDQNSFPHSQSSSPFPCTSSSHSSSNSLENQTPSPSLDGEVNRLQQEVARLKVEKLELLRQNMAAQREVKR